MKPEDIKKLLETRDRGLTDEEYRSLAGEYQSTLDKMAPILESCRKDGTSPTKNTEYDELRHIAAPIKDRLLTDDEERSLEDEKGYLAQTREPGRIPKADPQSRGGKKYPFDSFGDQLVSVAQAGKNEGRAIDPRLAEVRTISGLSESVPSDGGFLVQPDYGTQTLQRTYETGVLSSRVTRIPIGADKNSLVLKAIDETSRVNGSRFGALSCAWEGEAGTIDPSKVKWDVRELKLKKLTGLYYATDELIADTVSLGDVVQRAFAQEFAFKIDDAIFRGTGAGQPHGFMGSSALVTVAKDTGQVADSITFKNVVNMYSRMWGRSLVNAVFFGNQDVFPKLYETSVNVGTGGNAVFVPPGGLSASPYATLMGRPLIPCEYCATLGDTGDLVFVDLSEYLMIEKGGLQAASSIHVRFLNDETVFRFVYRTDGRPAWRTTLTPYKGSNDISPFVALAARA